MNDLTETQLKEWFAHPATKAVFEEINEAIAKRMMDTTLVIDSADATAIKTAFRDGQIEGLNALLDCYEYTSR